MTEYNLADTDLLHNKSKKFMVWIPETTVVVLGASNKAETALFLNKIEEDSIPVMKRPSGGQTVMLTPKNIIVSVAFHDVANIQPKNIFNEINALLINCLENKGVQNLTMRGISDIAIGAKKILGSSISWKKNVLLYHAVLNINEPASTFEKYLKHPSREPDYREGRNHSDFVTSLHEAGFELNAIDLQKEISVQLEAAYGKKEKSVAPPCKPLINARE